MKKQAFSKLSFEELSPERQEFARVLTYVLDRVHDPYFDDSFFRHDVTEPNKVSYFLQIIIENLQEL